ncbi:MAG: hypothetical protein U0Z53_02690 [Blastocatellia bacterium]
MPGWALSSASSGAADAACRRQAAPDGTESGYRFCSWAYNFFDDHVAPVTKQGVEGALTPLPINDPLFSAAIIPGHQTRNPPPTITASFNRKDVFCFGVGFWSDVEADQDIGRAMRRK